MPDDDIYGQDLDLGFVADEEGRVLAGPYSRVDLQPVLREGISPRETDLGIVKGRANMTQSLILRLKTEVGELAELGHPGYGSRHHRLIGEPNTEATRNLIKLYILECLKQERRLEAIQKVSVEPGRGRERRHEVTISVQVVLKGSHDPLSFVVPFSLEGPLE